MVKSKAGDITQKLVHLRKPVLRISTLAIHLERQEKFEFNKETAISNSRNGRGRTGKTRPLPTSTVRSS